MNGNTIFNNAVYDYEKYNHSQIRKNRDYLISQQTAQELNTYLSFNPFWTFTDQYQKEVDDKGNEINKSKKIQSPKGVRSIFNKQAAVSLATSSDVTTDSEWRLSNNVPLLDSRKSRQAIKESSACTVKDLVYASSTGQLGRETYAYSDFMYCKHLGKMPNNYLITLRRFPIPVDDYISQIGITPETRADKDLKNNNLPSVGCLVTWMGTPGNDMNNILKYQVKMPFKEQQAKWEQPSGGAEEGVKSGKLFNNIAAAFDPTYNKWAAQGAAPLPFGNYLSKISAGKISSDNPYTVSQITGWMDSNKTYGPVDAIKSTYMRDGDAGIKFDYNITLTFDYELRAYNGINGRQAMLDLIANILAVTYTTGTFWGGGYRGGGAHQNNIFTNLQMFKAKGGFNEFVDAFAQDYSTVTKGARDQLKAQGGDNWLQNAMSLMKSALNMMGGMILGGMLNNLGRPQKIYANSLLSSAPVGYWHVTIGNPFHPIMSMGNMILTNTTIEHYGPLGLDDFPTGLKVTCELTRGKPRDLRGIENLYMHGNDRIYSVMGPQIMDMYNSAKEYKSEKNPNTNKTPKKEKGNSDLVIPSDSSLQGVKIKSQTYKEINNIIMKYFGDTDLQPINFASSEQEYGASKKKKDSSK